MQNFNVFFNQKNFFLKKTKILIFFVTAHYSMVKKVFSQKTKTIKL